MRTVFTALTGSLMIIFLGSYAVAHQPRVLSFEDFEPKLHSQNDTTYLVNFWASWCKPCVDELPAIEQIGEEYRDHNFKVLLVSLDFPNQIDSRLIPFIEKHQISSEVMVLNDPDANSWINKVHPGWSGAIPATLIYNKNSREFYERTFSYEEFKSIVEQKLTLK